MSKMRGKGGGGGSEVRTKDNGKVQHNITLVKNISLYPNPINNLFSKLCCDAITEREDSSSQTHVGVGVDSYRHHKIQTFVTS